MVILRTGQEILTHIQYIKTMIGPPFARLTLRGKVLACTTEVISTPSMCAGVNCRLV
jgi:hypothetical protein